MREDPICERMEELFSDHLEGALEPARAAEVEAHLRACARCTALREAVVEVTSALSAFPALDPPTGLAERVASAALRAARSVPVPLRGVATRLRPAMPPAWLQVAAALLAAVTTAGVLYVTRSEAPARAASRLLDRTQNAGTYLIERKDRLVEDVRLLRVVITTAFEGRIDRMNDRVDDYKRLLERRRAQEEQQKKSRGSATFGNGPLTVEASPFRTRESAAS